MSFNSLLLNSLLTLVLYSACGGVQLTEQQKKECISSESTEEIEIRFLKEPVSLPEGLDCLQKPSKSARRISSHFRDSDHTFRPGGHTGTDYPMSAGSRINAIGPGVVTYAQATASDVNIVVVDMGEGWKFQVLHLSKILVEKGEMVSTGQRIGLSGGAVGAPGSGPCTTGPHLHISVSYQGKYTNLEDLYCKKSSR